MDRDRSMARARRFLSSLALVALCCGASLALAVPRTGLDYITDADCDTEACTSASAPGCREGNVLYFCNTGTGFYVPAASVVVPGGSTTQVQFNSSGAFAGDAGMTFNSTTDTLTVEGLTLGVAGLSSPSSGATFGGALTLTTGGLVLSQAGATVDGKNLDNAAMEDEENVFAKRNKFTHGFADYGPRAMVTITADCHVTETSCATTLKTLANTYNIPITVYVQRSPDSAESISAAQLASLASDPLVEIGTHTCDHPGGYETFESGWSTISASNTVKGGMTDWNSSTFGVDAGDLIVWNRQDTVEPKRITVVTDATTMTINNSTDIGFRRKSDYAIFDAYDTGTVTVDGSPTPSAVVTGSGTAWTSTTSGVVKARTSGYGSMVIIEGAPANPYYVSTVDSATQITLTETLAVDLTGVAYAIVPGAYVLADQVTVSRSEIRTDASDSTLTVEAFAAPHNTWGKFWGPTVAGVGITTATTGANGGFRSWNLYNGALNPLNLNRHMTQGRDTGQDMINRAQAAIDSGSWVIFNVEETADNKSDTGTVATNGTDQVTGTGTTLATDSVGSGDFIVIDGASRGYQVTSRSGEVLTLSETLATADQNLSGKTFYVVDTAKASDTAESSEGAITDLFEWLDANRTSVMPINITAGMKRARHLSSERYSVDHLYNPKFRVTNSLAFSAITSTTRNRWDGWNATGGDLTRLQEDSRGGLKMVHSSSLSDTVALDLYYLEPGRTYTLRGEIDVQSVTGTPTTMRACIDRGFFFTDNQTHCAPNGKVVDVGRYPFSITFSTAPSAIMAYVTSAAAAGSFPIPAYPINKVKVESHTASSGIYVISHPPVDGGVRPVVASRTADVACTTSGTDGHQFTVTCRTIAATPAASDADFTVMIPQDQIAAIGMLPPKVSLEFNGQGTVSFLGMGLSEAMPTTATGSP